MRTPRCTETAGVIPQSAQPSYLQSAHVASAQSALNVCSTPSGWRVCSDCHFGRDTCVEARSHNCYKSVGRTRVSFIERLSAQLRSILVEYPHLRLQTPCEIDSGSLGTRCGGYSQYRSAANKPPQTQAGTNLLAEGKGAFRTPG